MTLTEPIDLSAHDSVTLSFYRWMDAGMGDGEFLGVDIGNNGSYRRLQNWDKQAADGQWHLETITLSKEQIRDTFSLRFFAITRNAFTTIAVDNIMISAVPGSVVVEPIPEEEETTGPDLALSDVTATPTTAAPGDRVTLSAQVVNDGLTGFAVKTVPNLPTYHDNSYPTNRWHRNQSARQDLLARCTV